MTLPDSTESPQDLHRRFPVRDRVRVRVERAHPHRARIAIRRILRKQVEAAHVFVSAVAADDFVKVHERIRASVRAERVGPRTEEFLAQIREAVALLDALSPRERVADHGDAVAVGRFGRNLAIAEAEAVGSVRRTAGAAGDEIAGAAARLRATELKACEEL